MNSYDSPAVQASKAWLKRRKAQEKQQTLARMQGQRRAARAFLDTTTLPDGFVPVCIVTGIDVKDIVQFFNCDMPDGEATQDTTWSKLSELRFNSPGGNEGFNAFALAAAARERWPEVKVYDCKCTCCVDGLDLVTDENIRYFYPETVKQS